MEKVFPIRKSTRLKSFDYSSAGAYFVTVCTEGRRPILSEIIKTNFMNTDKTNNYVVGEGSALPKLTPFGEITDRVINEISLKYPGVSVDHYVIMPDHIHMVLSVIKDSGRADPSPTIESIVGWMKYRITKDVLQMCESVQQKIFQRSFYDHVIRNHDDYNEIVNYIYENPQRWYYKHQN